MCTITLGWKILILITFALYSIVLIACGGTTEKYDAEKDLQMKNVSTAAELFIIFVALIIVWFLLS